jgi:hypothetical protein
MSQAVVRSRPLTRWERWRHKTRRRFDRYRNNLAVGVAFVIVVAAALLLLGYLFA